MEDPANKQNEGSPSPSEPGFSQADVDALVNAAATGEASSANGADATAPAAQATTPEPAAKTRVDPPERSFDEAAAAVHTAVEEDRPKAANSASSSPLPPSPLPETRSFDLPDLGTADVSDIDARRVNMLSDVKLHVRIELGRTRMLVEDVLKLGEGSVVELDKLAGDPVDIFVNDRLVARGEVLVLNDSFCVRVSDVLSNDPHRVST